MNLDNYVFVAPGKAYLQSDFRSVVFRFTSESAQAIIEGGYSQANGFVTKRAAISGASHGYFVGGSVANNQRLVKLSFMTDGATHIPGVLSRRHPRSVGADSASHGYAFGATSTSDDRQGVFVDKVAFATDAVAVAGDLASPSGSYDSTLWSQGFSTFRAAYLRSSDDSDVPDTWSRYMFVGEAHSVVSLAAPGARQTVNPIAYSGNAAYVPISPSNVIEKFMVYNETSTVLGLSLIPSGVSTTAAASSASKGYLPATNGTTYGILFISDTEQPVSTALQGTSGASVNSTI